MLRRASSALAHNKEASTEVARTSTNGFHHQSCFLLGATTTANHQAVAAGASERNSRARDEQEGAKKEPERNERRGQSVGRSVSQLAARLAETIGCLSQHVSWLGSARAAETGSRRRIDFHANSLAAS